jgi:hypothetical protein
MVKHLVLLLALAVSHVAAAAAAKSHSRTQSDKYAAWSTQATQVLSARADADSLATAAALSAVGSLAALDLAARASQLAPQDSGIGWLRLQLCGQSPACDMRDIATVMRWVDPDNAAAWLPTLAAAQRDKDTTEVDRVLADMAREAHFDFYWNRLVILMFDALDAVRSELSGSYAGSDSARYGAVNDIANSTLIPPLTPLLDACRESAALPERRDPCLKLSKTMQRGDTIIAQLMGFSIEKRLLAPDSKEARGIAERRRVLEWRVMAAAKFDDPLLPWTKNARARARIAQMRKLPREEDVCIAILREHKMALEPPEMHP